MEVVKFYSVNDKYGEFSNFALFPIKLDERIWPTTEYYFQAQKFLDKTNQEKYVSEYFNANKGRIPNKINKHCYILK